MKILKKIVKLSSPITGDSYRYFNNEGEISLLYPCYGTLDMFEIHSIKGDFELNDIVERYETLQEAESRISVLLNGSIITL